MAQHDYVIANGTGAAVRSDLNNGLAAIVSQNSGATAPSTTYAYQSWADTSTGVMKIRNGANNAWITLYQLDGEWTSIAFENGTAAAPSIYFKDSGTDTGIYSPGADQVAISTGGTVRLTTTTTGITSALPVDVPLGAVGTPSITFTGDLNTGIYSPGADQIAITTGGTVKATIDTGRLLVGTSTLPTGSSSGSITATNSIFTSGNVQGQYAGEGSITATTGTAVFKFKTVNTGNNRACFVKLSVFGRGGSTTVSNSPAAEYAFQLHMTNANVMTLNGAASIFEYTFIRATHFAFANLGGGEGTVTITNPVAIALSVGYKIEILNAPAGGVFYLDSVTYA